MHSWMRMWFEIETISLQFGGYLNEKNQGLLSPFGTIIVTTTTSSNNKTLNNIHLALSELSIVLNTRWQ